MSVTTTAEKAPVSSKAALRRGKPKHQADLRVVDGVRIDPSRDALLTDFGKKTLEDRYLLTGETFQGMFARVATSALIGALCVPSAKKSARTDKPRASSLSSA